MVVLERYLMAGTAGHVDHGKTALVGALTGIDTDRLEEEKRRGISIDLGFAHLELEGGLRIGFVDVPGHERFVKNMLAGVGGIDVVLFVIAADESIKPQTREHFDICRLLGIRTGVVALTKADLVSSEKLELTRLEVEEFVSGSFLEGAPIVAVSSSTGEGLDDLRHALWAAAAQTPPRDTSRHFRLPIDRSFSLRGFGTVVTGTLIAGSIRRDQELEAHPGGRQVRVRGIQVHGRPVERAVAGQRTALNLAGAEAALLTRGMVLSLPDLFHAVQRIDCRLELLPSARPLKNRAPVHFHAGTAEVEAEVRLLDGEPLAGPRGASGAEALLPCDRQQAQSRVTGEREMPPGSSAFVRILLRAPLLLLPGDRFIVRMFSPVVTIGGGVVLDIGGLRYRAKDRPAERLRALFEASVAGRVALLVREARYGVGVPELIARTGLTASEIEEAARSGSLLTLAEPQPWLVDRLWFENAATRSAAILRQFHQQNPLLAGMPKADLRSQVLPESPPFLLDALLARSSGIVLGGELVRLASHSLVLKDDEQRALTSIERAFESAGLVVPSPAEVLAGSGVEAGRARSLLQLLLREKRLIRVSEDLVFHASALARLRGLLAAHRGERFSVAEFKMWTGVSRKYAIPLLEHLDREHLTRREDNYRLVVPDKST